MEELTIDEAIKQGYTYFGIKSDESLHLYELEASLKIEHEFVEEDQGKLMLADIKPTIPSWSAEDIRELVAEDVVKGAESLGQRLIESLGLNK